MNGGSRRRIATLLLHVVWSSFNSFLLVAQGSSSITMPLPSSSSGAASTPATRSSSSPSSPLFSSPTPPPPIVYAIAGSDSGGGAGVQADLHAMRSFGCHGCAAVTCLTAQNSVGVSGVHVPPAAFLKQQLRALEDDLPPAAIKIGMLGTKDAVLEVASFLKRVVDDKQNKKKVWIVLDPVMISTSGHRLIDDEAQEAVVRHLFPLADIVTPNRHEAEALLSMPMSADSNSTITTTTPTRLESPDDVERCGRRLLEMGARSVLIKGGHALDSEDYAQDYFVSSSLSSSSNSESVALQPPKDGQLRLCDCDQGERGGGGGIWIRGPRYDTENTHGTGCTLSSSIAAALALGETSRRRPTGTADTGGDGGAVAAIFPVDACCLGKAYVAAGIARGVQLGQGPGPVVHTSFPSSNEHFPKIVVDPRQPATPPFRSMRAWGAPRDLQEEGGEDDRPVLGRILPIVGSVEWVKRLCEIGSGGDNDNEGVKDIQFRIKDDSLNDEQVLELVRECQALCREAGIRLWINDYWEAAIEAGCFGVHLGQEDLYRCVRAGGIEALRQNGLALGISTHSYGELAAALGAEPSYISLGPVFKTGSKTVNFRPQGLDTVRRWRGLLPPGTPLVAIGGIGDVETAARVAGAGADCCAVIGAVVNADDPASAVSDLNNAMNGDTVTVVPCR